MKKIVAITVVLVFPLYLLLSSVEFNTFQIKIFEKSFEENNTDKITGKSMAELINISEDLLNYLRGKDINLSKNFDEREVEHMKDVEDLFHYGFILKRVLFTISFIAIVYIIINKKYLYKNLDIIFKGFFVLWGLIGGLFILTIFDFTKYFTYFHLIFFDNDLWILDPDTSLMINMLPETFFINIFRNIVILFLIILLIIHIGLYFLRKKLKNQSIEGGNYD